MDFESVGGFALNAAKDMYSKGYNIKQYLGLEAAPKKTGLARVGQYFGDLGDAVRGRGVATHASTGLGQVGAMLGIQGRKLSFGERAGSYFKNIGTAIRGNTQHANQSPYAFIGGIVNRFSPNKQQVMDKIRSDNKDNQSNQTNQSTNTQANTSPQQSTNNAQSAQQPQQSAPPPSDQNNNSNGGSTPPPPPSNN